MSLIGTLLPWLDATSRRDPNRASDPVLWVFEMPLRVLRLMSAGKDAEKDSAHMHGMREHARIRACGRETYETQCAHA